MTEEKNLEMNEINEQALEETAGGSKNYDYQHFLPDHAQVPQRRSHLRLRLAERRRDPGPRLLHRERLALRLSERQIRLC